MTGQKLRLNLFETTKNLTHFSLPIIFGQLGIMLISLGDVYVSSRHGTLSAAALGVAVAFTNPIFLFGVGLQMGIAPLLSIKRGKGEQTSHFYFSNLFYSILVSFIVMILVYFLYIIIPYLNLEKEIIPLVRRYIFITLWSFPAAFIFQGIKEHLQALEKVFMANLVAFLAVGINLIFNFGFVFGKWGLPLLGYDGLAYASLGVRGVLAIVMLLLTVKFFKNIKIDFKYIKELFQFSFPIAGMYFLEVLGFCAVSILIGTIGIKEAAANNIVLNLASVTFMIPLSISSAVTVKVGLEYGSQNYLGILRYFVSSLFLSELFMCFTCIIFFTFPYELMGHMSDNKDVINIGVSLLFVVGLFQLVDGIQVTLAGILRGLEKTKESFYAILVGYWFVGLPLGIYLSFYQDMKAQGLWIGLAISLTIISLVLGVISKRLLKTLKISFSRGKN